LRDRRLNSPVKSATATEASKPARKAALHAGLGAVAEPTHQAGRGFEMHRHDTYAIGRTLSGVQSFHYRGAVRSSLPGDTIVLHPDEKHDGQAGTVGGFRYRLVYLHPSAIQQALGGRKLPFIPGGISANPRVFAAAGRLLRPLDERLAAAGHAGAHAAGWAGRNPWSAKPLAREGRLSFLKKRNKKLLFI
jgi:hypothetical protein